MITLGKQQLAFHFPEVHLHAVLRVELQRTLRLGSLNALSQLVRHTVLSSASRLRYERSALHQGVT